MGLDGALSVDEKMGDSGGSLPGDERLDTGKNWNLYVIVLLVAGSIYLGCIISPPSLMDDVDAVQAQIARNMLTSGDWVTARLDGVVYLEKAPLVLGHCGQLHDFRRTRLGSADSDCLVGHGPVLVNHGVRRLGIR